MKKLLLIIAVFVFFSVSFFQNNKTHAQVSSTPSANTQKNLCQSMYPDLSASITSGIKTLTDMTARVNEIMNAAQIYYAKVPQTISTDRYNQLLTNSSSLHQATLSQIQSFKQAYGNFSCQNDNIATLTQLKHSFTDMLNTFNLYRFSVKSLLLQISLAEFPLSTNTTPTLTPLPTK